MTKACPDSDHSKKFLLGVGAAGENSPMAISQRTRRAHFMLADVRGWGIACRHWPNNILERANLLAYRNDLGGR